MDWRKAARSHANGNCVEVAGWRVPASCQGGACVEVGSGDALVAVRDSQLADSPVLEFGAATWREFAGRVKRDGTAAP